MLRLARCGGRRYYGEYHRDDDGDGGRLSTGRVVLLQCWREGWLRWGVSCRTVCYYIMSEDAIYQKSDIRQLCRYGVGLRLAFWRMAVLPIITAKTATAEYDTIDSREPLVGLLR